MQLNLDCIRDVLLELETFPIGLYTVNSFQSCLSKYSDEQVLYTLVKLCEGSSINALFSRTLGGRPIISAVYDITFQGHEFLEKIRSDNVWNNNLKPAFSSIGSVSLDVVSKVASTVIAALVTSKLGL